MAGSNDASGRSDDMRAQDARPPGPAVRSGSASDASFSANGDHGSDAPTLDGRDRMDEPTRASDVGTGGAPAVDLEGARIAGYQLLEEIHRGGQGVVYRAIQLGTKRLVALKVLLEGPFASEATRRRFEREVELAASLRHPAIVTILDSGVSEGRYYFAMEYIDGLRLDRYLAKVRPPLRETLALFEKICQAINFAHQRGVIHRDLKPPNILIDDAGEPHVLDFGLAKPAQTAGPEQTTVQMLSSAGQLLGTVAYMSPEQSIGSQDVDVRTDVYSLGVVFYEGLLGQLPYSVEGPLGEVLTRIAQAEPRRPRIVRTRSRFGSLVDDELETILLKTLDKTPGRRYQTAGELGRDLQHLLAGEPIEAKRASNWYIFRKLVNRYRLQAAAIAVVVLMMGVFLVVFAFLWSAESAASEEAEALRREALQGQINERLARQELELALIQQTIQRGHLAQASGDLIQARDFYWEAYQNPDRPATPAALWALREYYLHSGDDGATVLSVESRGPTALSPDGDLAAVCEAPSTIAVHRVANGQSLRRLYAPGPVTVLSTDNQGSVCAAGKGWARCWREDVPGGVLAAEVSDRFDVRAVHSLSDGSALLLVGRNEVRLVAQSDASSQRSAKLFGETAGLTDYSPEQAALAIPTSAGMELALIDEFGELRSEMIGLEQVKPRLARYVGQDLLAVTDETIYATNAAGASTGSWRPFRDAPSDRTLLTGWELLDIHSATGALAVARGDGTVMRFRDGELENSWQVSRHGLVGLRLSAQGDAVITADGAGTVSRWIPPLDERGARAVLARPLTASARAEDGSAVLLGDARARVFAYAPQRTEGRELLSARRGFRLRLPGEEERTALAVSRQADYAVVCTGNAIRLRDRNAASTYNATWNDPTVGVLTDVAIAGDGSLIAITAQTEAGDQQHVSFWGWEPRVKTARSVELSALLPRIGQPVEFVGSFIREMAFVPRTSRLLVARSNGDLLLLDPRGTGSGPGPAPPARPWVRLEAPPTALAFDRLGRYLAVACTDGSIRLLSTGDGALLKRIRVGQHVHMLAFGPRSDVLMVRGADDTVSIIEVDTAEPVAQLGLGTAADETFATWIGNDDAMLISHDGGVYEHDYEETDRRISRHRVYGRQRAGGRFLAEGRFASAWAVALDLELNDRAAARSLRQMVLVSALRRVGQNIEPQWLSATLSGATPQTRLRLGHAAYDGERFALAHEWLHSASEQLGGEVDVYTALRIAQCDYLVGNYRLAADGFDTVLKRSGFPPASVPSTQLQRAAALVLADDLDEARMVAQEIDALQQAWNAADDSEVNAARNIARTLTGLDAERSDTEGESSLVAIVGQFVGEVTAESLRGFYQRFYDDVHFFAAELARARGQSEEAAADYQRCIDVARDRWPANWARYRLRQLFPGP